MSRVYAIPDDPIISSMERTGYPPWMSCHIGYHPCDSAWEEEDPDEHYDYYRSFEPVAVYEGEGEYDYF